jgi:hypothetical protein
VLCACDFLSYIRSHTGALLASALAVGAAVVVVTIALTGPHPHICRSYRWSRSHIRLVPTVTTGPTAIFCISYDFRPSVSTSILASVESVNKTFGRLYQLLPSTIFELLMLKFIVGIDGNAALHRRYRLYRRCFSARSELLMLKSRVGCVGGPRPYRRYQRTFLHVRVPFTLRPCDGATSRTAIFRAAYPARSSGAVRSELCCGDRGCSGICAIREPLLVRGPRTSRGLKE